MVGDLRVAREHPAVGVEGGGGAGQAAVVIGARAVHVVLAEVAAVHHRLTRAEGAVEALGLGLHREGRGEGDVIEAERALRVPLAQAEGRALHVVRDAAEEVVPRPVRAAPIVTVDDGEAGDDPPAISRAIPLPERGVVERAGLHHKRRGGRPPQVVIALGGDAERTLARVAEGLPAPHPAGRDAPPLGLTATGLEGGIGEEVGGRREREHGDEQRSEEERAQHGSFPFGGTATGERH